MVKVFNMVKTYLFITIENTTVLTTLLLNVNVSKNY